MRDQAWLTNFVCSLKRCVKKMFVRLIARIQSEPNVPVISLSSMVNTKTSIAAMFRTISVVACYVSLLDFLEGRLQLQQVCIII